MDFEKVREQVAQGWITVGRHPNCELYIYNYAKRCQWERAWTPETMACRGLIADGRDRIVARPFPKFFNLGEPDTATVTFTRPFTVTQKLDGSLGILYRAPDGWAIATRGSFTSDQALRATQILRDRYTDFEPDPTLTYLFEIIYPTNRIVIDYGDQEDLILLAVRDTQRDVDLDELAGWAGPVVTEYAVPAWWSEAEGHSRPSFEKVNWFDQFGLAQDGTDEGLVFRFDTEHGQTRVKMKVDEYVRLHKLMTGTSTKTVWEYLSHGTTLDLLLDQVPDEFYHWVRDTATDLQEQYNRIWDLAAKEYHDVLDELSDQDPAAPEFRKQFAALAKDKEYTGLLFGLLDENHERVQDQIWKMVRPEYAKPFTNDVDA